MLVSPIHPVDPPENAAQTIIPTPAPRHQVENDAAQTSAALTTFSTPSRPNQQVENVMDQTTQQVDAMTGAELIKRLRQHCPLINKENNVSTKLQLLPLAEGSGYQDEDENDSSVPSTVTTSARQQKVVENTHLLAMFKRCQKRNYKSIEKSMGQ